VRAVGSRRQGTLSARIQPWIVASLTFSKEAVRSVAKVSA
jgi:hypothetical protein